ncbi:MAG: AAA family ATPase [Pseudomonadota bacterium]|nr:AAA family ATPase [Pseudomonadota bacterium]
MEISITELALSISKRYEVPVFPCNEDKSPLTPHGFKDASDDPERIQELFNNPRAALVGMPTGEISGISVLDLDVPKKEGEPSGLEWLDQNIQYLPITLVIKTRRGGRHLYYRHIKGVKNTAGKIAPRVDTRGDGGYVITAGSGYELRNDVPLNELPPFPMEIFKSEEPAAQLSTTESHDLTKIFEPGQWHNIVRDWTAAAINRGDSEQTIIDVAPLLTLKGFTLEQTNRELKTFIDGAISKGYAPEKSTADDSTFKLKNYNQLMELEDPTFIVEDLLVDNSFAMIFGPTGSFKSTVMLDMCVCIQHGLSWQGKNTQKTNVAIFSHEDGSEFKKRFLAAVSCYSIQDPVIYWDSQVPNLLNQKLLDHYIEELRVHEIGLLVIDTFAYAVAGAEENSSKDMGIAIDSIRQLRDAINGTILIIHHSGKNIERGARGSSSIKAAADTEIKIEAEEYEIAVSATKQRHCALGNPFYLKAVVVDVENSTACVIKTSAAFPHRKGGHGLKGQSLTAWRVLEPMMREKESCEIDDYLGHLERNSLFTKKQTQTSSFKTASKRVIKAFENRNLIAVEDGTITMTKEAR